MSSKRLSSTGEGLPSSRHGERTPLRSLGNDMQRLSTPSHRLKSKCLLSADDLKTTQGDVALSDSEPHTPANSENTANDVRAAENTCQLGDVTFKSSNFTGGEVVISDSACAEESLVLADNQVMKNTCDIEDTVMSVSMIVESCSGHIEHPFSKPEIKDVSSVDNKLTFLHEILAATVDTDSNDECTPQDSDAFQSDCCGENDVTWKTLVCDGVEVEISHHPHCSSQTGVPGISTLPESQNCSDKCVSAPSKVTFNSFNSTGGEIEIPDGTKHGDETAPLESTTLPVLFGDRDLPNCKDHFDHPYCNTEKNSTIPNGRISSSPETLPHSSDVMSEVKQSLSNIRTGIHDRATVDSAGLELEDSAHLPEKTSPTGDVLPAYVTQYHIQEDCTQPNCHVIKKDDNMQETAQSVCPENSDLPEVGYPTPGEGPEDLIPSDTSPESSGGKDSALGSTCNEPVLCISGEKPTLEKECPSVASALQLHPHVRRASLSTQNVNRDPIPDQFLGDDPALDFDKTITVSGNLNPLRLLGEYLESPMPRPLFNSTALCSMHQLVPTTETDVDVQPLVMPQSKVEKPALVLPEIQDGPLQQQLQQMAEFLMLASRKMLPTATSERANPVEIHSMCVGTTSVQMVDHSLNTSGQFEKKREFSVADSCTLTDPLLWNVPPGSLECLPRQELEQRLTSSMIMVEALVQQLAAARAHGCSSTGPAPSELREKLVQTEHTELKQTTMYRDLYLEALSRISQLELDGHLLHTLIQSLQDTRVNMTSLSSDTEAALSTMSHIGDSTREDHQSLVSHYGQMKSLLEKTRETQKRMMQKVKDALQQRNDMRTQMEEAFTAQEAAFGVTRQLRTHCAAQMSELEKCVGSQRELLAALNQAHPEQVALNQAYNQTLNSVSELLNQTIEDQSSLMKELCATRGLVQRTAPMLVKLNEKAAAALRARDEHASAREQAMEEREQMEEELSQANVDLQAAREEIGDLKLQVTILTSEMDVLRQKFTEHEEERGQLERKVTELSATVSSSLASYTFLEQALAAETTKLQQSRKDVQQTRDRANELEMSLGQSEQRVSGLSQALVQSQEQLSQLQMLSQSQEVQLQHFQDLCKQLNGVQEMNEFLQMENELAREQVVESESMLRANLQGLRERNIECEDLKVGLGQLQLENRSLHEQLESTRCRARESRQQLEGKLAHAVTEITLLHHTLRGLTSELQAALCDQTPEASKEVYVERRHPSSSFIDRVMVALTSEEVVNKGTLPEADIAEPQCETLFSETSAFSRIAAITPKKNVKAEPEEDERPGVAELLADLRSTVAALVDTVNLVRQRKDSQLKELHGNMCDLQREQQAANSRHDAQVFELKYQLQHLSSLVEKGRQVLQQKTQDEKNVAKLMAELGETHEILNKHKTESNELRKEVVELRRSLQQSQVESQFLREELRSSGGKSATPANFMEDKLQLLKEVERLKSSLCEADQARVKLLERAKRHQMIHQNNQLKSENELQILSSIINKVRETLLSLPEIVSNCEQLQQLAEYIG